MRGARGTKHPAQKDQVVMPAPQLPVSPISPLTPSTDPTAEPTRLAFKATLDARRAALLALPEERVYRRSRLDLTTVCTIAMGAAQRVAPHREALVALCGPVAGELVDGLRATAMAARQANIELSAAEEATVLAPLHRDVMAKYTVLITDADSLVNRGHLPKDRLDKARDLQGYQATVDSLMVLIAVLREHLDRIAGITPITVADLDGAEAVALRMADAIAARNHGVLRAPAAELRVRALSQLVHEHSQLRRMVTYLRWDEDDVDSIVPSLYAGRGRRPSSDVPETDEPNIDEPALDDTDGDEPPPPARPSPNNGGGPFTS